MTDCPNCKQPVDGLFCERCEARRRSPRTAPPMGFDGLLAKCQPRKRDPEAEAEREAIQAEAFHMEQSEDAR